MSSSTGQSLQVPVDAMISTLPLVHFLPPGYLRNPAQKETGWVVVKLEVKTDAPRNPSRWKEYTVPDLSVRQHVDIDALARTLAKIAHAICVANLGIDFFDHWLPPYILGHDPALSYLVGGSETSKEPTNSLHDIRYEVTELNGQWLVTCNIRLFGQFGGPHAKVIVGKTTRDQVEAFTANLHGGEDH